MTVINVTTKYGGLSGSGQLDGVRDYTKVLIVRTDSNQDGVITIGNAIGVPRKGDVYFFNGEVDASALCTDVTPRQDPGNQLVWEVTCQFSSDLGPGGGVTADPRYDVDQPLQSPPVVTWSWWTEHVVVERDVWGTAILNRAGFPYDPPVTKRVKFPSVIIQRNESTFPVEFAQTYIDTVNLGFFYGWKPGQARVDSITAQSQFKSGVSYWAVRYEIHFRKPDWKKSVLNAGTIYLDDEDVLSEGGGVVGTVKAEVLPSDKNGITHTNPILLDAEGGKLTPEEVALGGAIYDDWEIYESQPFAGLNL